MRFVLASASPARLNTLRRAGVRPEVIVSGVDENALSAPTVAELVQVLADAKAAAVAAELTPLRGSSTLVLGCDSLLELDAQPFGKPDTAEQATQRWRQLRGRTATLHTGHALLELGASGSTATPIASARSARATASTEVTFSNVSDAEIDFYVATGEPLQVAGAFTIDGRGGWFIEAVRGDHHNVVGLSLPLLRRMLAELGYQVADLPAG